MWTAAAVKVHHETVSGSTGAVERCPGRALCRSYYHHAFMGQFVGDLVASSYICDDAPSAPR